MSKIYVIRISGGEWSDSWTSNLCAKYSLAEAEDFIKESELVNQKAKMDLAVLNAEEERWELENDYEYEEQVPMFALVSDDDKLKIDELKKINREIDERNAEKHRKFYEDFELHMEKFAADNNLTRGGSEYEDTYYTIDEIDLT